MLALYAIPKSQLRRGESQSRKGNSMQPVRFPPFRAESTSVSPSMSVTSPRAICSGGVPGLWTWLETMPVFSGGSPVRIAACVDDVTVGFTGTTRVAWAVKRWNAGEETARSAERPSKETRITRCAAWAVVSRGGGGGGGWTGGGAGVEAAQAVRISARKRLNEEFRMENEE